MLFLKFDKFILFIRYYDIIIVLSKDLIIVCNIKAFTWFPCWLYGKHIEAYSGTPGYKALLLLKIPQGFEKHGLYKQMFAKS